MQKAIGSKVNLKNMEDMLAVEYMSCVWDLMDEKSTKIR